MSSLPTSVTPNAAANVSDHSAATGKNGTGSYYGAAAQFYAFSATGGFSMNQGFNQIKFQTENAISTFDLTNAVQVSFDVRAFNRKLGIFKDTDNITLLPAAQNVGEGAGIYYDTVNDQFVNTASGSPVAFDSITLTADQFRTGLTNASQVLSVGYYNTLYSDFISYVKSYFGYAGGFSTLFQNAETFNYNNGLFDGSALINLINASGIPMTDPSAAFIQNVSGSITIPNVTEVLRFAVDSNCFGNRTPAVTSAAGSNTSTDPTDHSNYGVQDGFIAGDLIWVPTGTTVTLGVGIDSEAVSSALNNIGPAATSALISQLNSSVALNYTQSGAPFSSQTSATLTKISRTLTAPLVIRLDNLSNQKIVDLKYNITAIPVPNQTFKSASLSVSNVTGTYAYTNGNYAVSWSNANWDGNDPGYKALNGSTTSYFQSDWRTYNMDGSYMTGQQNDGHGINILPFSKTLATGSTIAGEFIQIAFPYSLQVTRFEILGTGTDTQPKLIYILGSNTGTNDWTVVSTQTCTQTASKLSFSIPNTTYYTYYCLVINSVYGGSDQCVQVVQWNLYGNC